MPILSFKSKDILSGNSLKAAIQAMREDGIVVIEEAVSLDHIALLRERMLADVELLLKRDDKPFNWNPGNLQQDPPPFSPFLFRDILVNDAAIAVTRGILGPGVKNALYSGNTALPSEHRQPVHADLGQLWPEQEIAHPAYGIVVNIPLVDMSEANGSTEMWPGTHKDTSVAMQDGDIKVSDAALAARRNIEPPVQPTVLAGSIVLRDVRMWHAGMPNHTDAPRPMVGMIHYVSWWPTSPVRFSKGAEPYLEHPDLFTHAEFAEELIDHIAAPAAYEYAKT